MRPNIDLAWPVHGAIKELADDREMSLTKAYEVSLKSGVEVVRNERLGPEEYRVRNDGQSLSYGPWNEDRDEWSLGISTAGDGRIRLLLGETAMYELWTEVHNTPQPGDATEEGTLVREVVERANGADAEMLRSALSVLEGEG